MPFGSGLISSARDIYGEGPQLNTGGDGYEESVAAAKATANSALQTAGVLGTATLDDYISMENAESGLCPFAYYVYSRPVSGSYSSTITTSQTESTATGEKTIDNTTTISYVMVVTGDDTSGTFTLDILVGVTTDYTETGAADSETGAVDASLSVPGTYQFTIHATGSYSSPNPGSAPYAVTAGYTLQEDRSCDVFGDSTATIEDAGVTGAKTSYNLGHGSASRVETGSFGPGGLSATYQIAYSCSSSSTTDPTATDPAPANPDGGLNLVSWGDSSYQMSYTETGTRTGSTTTGTFSYFEYRNNPELPAPRHAAWQQPAGRVFRGRGPRDVPGVA